MTCFLIEINPQVGESSKNILVAGATYFSRNRIVDRAHVSPIRNIRFFPRQSVEKSLRWKQQEKETGREHSPLSIGVWIGLVRGNSRRSRPLLHDSISLSLFLSLSLVSFSRRLSSFFRLSSLCYNVIYAE